MLQCYVIRRLSVVCDVRIVAKRCVLEQKLQSTVYLLDTRNRCYQMNGLDFCLEVV